MALISGGPPPGGSAPPAGTVLEQYQYSPYGELIVRDQLASKPTFNPIGHQGLFHQRHDAGPHLPPLDVGAVGLYYNRARFYSPSLGRFVQKDMNETALPLATALAMNGDALDVLFGAFDSAGHYGDGMNLFAYLGSNPVNGLDPSGLDEIDDLIDDITGQRLYALGAINEGARWASLGLQTSLDIAGSLLGVDVFQSVQVLASGRGGFWDALNIVGAVVPGSGPFRAIIKARKIRRAARAGRYTGKLLRHHTVPRAVLKKLRPDVAANGLVRGRRGSPNRWKIPEDLHKDIHRGARGGPWNDAWWRELDALGGPEKAEVQDLVLIRDKLIRLFGLEEYRP